MLVCSSVYTFIYQVVSPKNINAIKSFIQGLLKKQFQLDDLITRDVSGETNFWAK